MLAIITVNYNGTERIIKLLESLASQTDKGFKIFIVDNASEETDFNVLLTTCSTWQDEHVQIIRNSENLGFSGGNNVGIREALQNGYEWVVLLNNDIWVGNDFIARLKANLGGKEGLAGLPLIEGDRIAYAGKIRWRKPILSHIHTPVRLTMSNIYAIGGGMAIYKSVFDKIGLFDEKYFLYFEDADFSFRAKKAGFPLVFLEEPRANHQVSATTSKLGAPLLLRYHYRNAFYFNSKNGSWYNKILMPFWSLSILMKQILKIIIGKDREISKAIVGGVFDYHLGKMGKIND